MSDVDGSGAGGPAAAGMALATEGMALAAAGMAPATEGMAPAAIVVYSSPGCHLCEQAMSELRRLQAELGPAAVGIEERDITAEDALHRAYLERIPVIELDGEELCEYTIDEQLLRERLESRR